MKPTFLRGWKYIRETKKCYCMEKKGHGQTLVPKKQVLEAYKKQDEEGISNTNSKTDLERA